jgi:hypothetical protein
MAVRATVGLFIWNGDNDMKASNRNRWVVKIQGLLMALAVVVNTAAIAQTTAVDAPSKLTYSVKLGFFSPKLDYTRTTTASGMHLYAGRIPYLYDPKTFTFILLTKPQADFDPKMIIEGEAGVFEVGREWAVSFQEHPSAQARCNDLTQKNGKVKITAKQAENVTVQGPPQSVEVLVARVTGNWSSCGHEGSYERTIHYAPSLGAFTFSHSVTRLNTGQVLSDVSTKLEGMSVVQ